MRAIQPVITYGLYPLLLLATGFLAWNAINHQYDLTVAFIGIGGARFLFLQAVELLFPCEKRWSINWRNLLRDVKYGAANFLTLRGVGYLTALFSIEAAVDGPGLAAGMPLYIEVIAVALTYEFFQYWFHRLSHEGTGWWGDKLWRVHVAHHLPDRVYMIMHAVGHPINFLIVVWFVPLAVWFTGVSQAAVMVWFSFRGLHGLISHFNVEIRAGWLNYIFVGTELHRFHHSADLDESKNYSSFLIFWDLLFGTFVYKPGVNPARLGVVEPCDYPASNEALKVLALPFLSASKQESREDVIKQES
jgi:sterol desaturase/sphingolipid hydroxylase (fatty acid hydroxylase superfamily)